MVGGDEEDKAVNVGEWCELLYEPLARFDKCDGKLREKLSIASEREKQRQDGKRFEDMKTSVLEPI